MKRSLAFLFREEQHQPVVLLEAMHRQGAEQDHDAGSVERADQLVAGQWFMTRFFWSASYSGANHSRNSNFSLF